MFGVHRESLMGSYLDNMVAFLRTQFPQKGDEELQSFVHKVIREKLKRPKTTIIRHPSPGNSELVDVDLLTHIKEHSRRIIAPCGTVYKSTDEQTAFDKQFIDMLRNNRDVAKKAMLRYAAEGRDVEKSLEDFKQALCKILVNSIIGSNGNDKNAMYDLEAFNGVTSLARHGIIAAYAYVERFLTANFYFPDIEHAINYIITTKHYCPNAEVIRGITDKYSLVNPFPGEVAEALCSSINNYNSHTHKNLRRLEAILENMPQHEVTFVHYSRNLYNLFTYNTEFWKRWIADFLDTRSEIRPEDCTEIDPNNIRKIDGDLIQVIATVHADILKGTQVKDTAKKEDCQHIAQYLTAIGMRMQEKLDSISDILNTFLHNKAFVAHIHSQRNIIRKCVGISDTDSVIFTTKHLTSWYLNNEFKFSQETYNINAFIVYLLTKSIASFIEKMAISRGATGDNVGMIEMKNEFMYPVLIKTGIGKHYAGDYTIQEGNVLPTPKTDIKGVSFMSSNLPKVSHDFTKKILNKIKVDMLETCEIHLNDYILLAYDYEQEILESLKKGEFTYFPNISIKGKEEYKKPDSSVYVNYQFWQEVFSDKYGDIHIPTKVPIIPVRGKEFRNPTYLAHLEATSPSIHKKLCKYLDTLDKKKVINRVPLSSDLTTVPEELIPIVEMRPIVFKNLSPVQLALKSIGVDLGNAKKMPLFTDFYNINAV